MFFFVGLVNCFYEWLVECKNDPDCNNTQHNANSSKEWRIDEHGDERRNEFRKRIEIHEPILEKFFQCFISLSNSVDGGAAVMVLVPFYRQVKGLVVNFLQEISPKRLN